LFASCFAKLECKVVETRLVNKFNLFVLEVVKAWRDSKQKTPKTFHHQWLRYIRGGRGHDISEIQNALQSHRGACMMRLEGQFSQTGLQNKKRG